MAVISKKDALIEDAQKFVLRGQFDKAVKVYEQIIALKPGAINLRQKLAELLLKCGRNDDARKELEVIGRNFTKDGFYQKAIAVYKQLQKLFPADMSLSLTLAELNGKHGLVANSLSEYKLVYQFYENSGNFSEALDILNRMQNVDPRNIPIKIKLAETFFQQKMRVEAYTAFEKAAYLLLELGDSPAFSKLSVRVGQYFPDKPDFVLDVLTEQVRQGNAATAMDSIQGLLRSNPNDKRSWELVAKAYQLLEQPQRVKIAFQHYLKFFPTEPAAILGLISSVAAEQNLAGTVALLDTYESLLISGGFLQQLEQIYRIIDKIDPVNIRVMEGLVRVVTASGNESEALSLESRLRLLRSVSGKARNDVPTPTPPLFVDKTETDNDNDAPFFGETLLEQLSELPSIFGTENRETVYPSETEVPDIPAVATELPDEDFEIDIDIDIEIDIDAPFGVLDEEDAVESSGNGLDALEDLFGTISTAPRGVKFGNEMENSDTQSHFDLGQAFKEMGLYDEAITEFHQASQDPLRKIEGLIMLCACLRERGELEKAITTLQSLLKPGLREEESCAVKYELATGYETAGNRDAATVLLNEINAVNPDFRDVNSRLNAVSNSESLCFSDDDLKDFGFK